MTTFEQDLQEQIDVLKEQFKVACDRCEKWKELARLYEKLSEIYRTQTVEFGFLPRINWLKKELGEL